MNPKLRICKGSNTWYQSNVLGISLPFHRHLHCRISPFDLPKNCIRFWFFYLIVAAI
ncbi:hypothetical protein GW17_00053032 [Ensete ventricosum]|nr:hypothetical protein GW17_00053032 [Ensete ventricosum]RZR91309.1 hypothetical protein BHM03_00019396 [Ensete ventricosum]